MLTYFIKANIALAIFYLVYRLFFGRDTLFGMRRLTLWIMAVFALVYPFIRITLPAAGTPVFPVIGEGAVQSPFAIDGITVTAAALTHEVSLVGVCVSIYLAGTAFFLGRFLFQLFGIFLLARRSRKNIVDGITVRETDHPSAPFSFFGWIFVDPRRHCDEELREILTHERTHVRELHSVDVIFFDLLWAVLWLNPFAWLVKVAVRQNLEFLADKDVIRSGSDRRIYQYRLLQLSYNQPLSHLTNHFSKSQLKNRIAMMNKKQTSRRGTVKYAFILPAAFSVFLLSNVRAAAETAPANEAPRTAETAGAMQNTATVKGTVKDTNGAALEGVSVVVRGTHTGTVTDKDGRFSVPFNPSGGNALVFSMVGMETSELIVVEPEGEFQVVMKESSTPIPDIHIIGYVSEKPEPAVRQEPPAPPVEKKEAGEQATKSDISDDDYFMIVEDMPRFEGRDLNHFRKWVMEHIQYPAEAQKEKQTGNVIISFVIEKDGRLSNINILSNTPAPLNNEAVRVVSSSPKWEPGKQRNVPVRVKFTMPIHFALSE